MRIKSSLILSLLLSVNVAFADGMKRYEVTITNITKGQSFTPRLVAIHKAPTRFFTLGHPAGSDLEALAEGGDISGVVEAMEETGAILTENGGLLGPGETTTIEINARGKYRYLSVAAMLLPTNDTFLALSSVKLPKKRGKSISYLAPAYDAGTEENDENCANIPGPHCGGTPFSDESNTDEGYVYISNGIHGIGDLTPEMYDWNGPVALVTITKVNKK